MLTTGTAGSIRIDTQIIFLDIHIQIFNDAGFVRVSRAFFNKGHFRHLHRCTD